MSRKNRKDSKKAKKAMAEKETRIDNNDSLKSEEQDTCETPETEIPAGEPEELKAEEAEGAVAAAEEEAEVEDTGEEPEESSKETDTGAEPENADAARTGEEKPKKERKLKWTRSGGAEKKADPFQEKFAEISDRYARLFAEFDNFRKRSDKEKTQRYDFGVKDTVEKILPVIDNFERGLAAVPEEKAEDSFVTGMQMIYKQLMKALEDIGVKPIEAVGQEFNPDFHNAVMHVDDPEAGDNIIVEEFQKGYMYKDHVVRYSMVKVAN